MKTLKSLLMGSALAAASFTAAHAADPKVADIDVTIEFASADANALQFYPNLEADLESKLAETLAPMMDASGGRIQVIVKDLSVDGNEILNTAGDFNTLGGGVFFYPVNPDKSEDASAVNPETTDVSVVAVPEYPTVMPTEGPVLIMAPSDQTVYDAMIQKFADVVAERLPTL